MDKDSDSSMDDILDSIRQIISEEPAGNETPAKHGEQAGQTDASDNKSPDLTHKLAGALGSKPPVNQSPADAAPADVAPAAMPPEVDVAPTPSGAIPRQPDMAPTPPGPVPPVPLPLAQNQQPRTPPPPPPTPPKRAGKIMDLTEPLPNGAQRAPDPRHMTRPAPEPAPSSAPGNVAENVSQALANSPVADQSVADQSVADQSVADKSVTESPGLLKTPVSDGDADDVPQDGPNDVDALQDALQGVTTTISGPHDEPPLESGADAGTPRDDAALGPAEPGMSDVPPPPVGASDAEPTLLEPEMALTAAAAVASGPAEPVPADAISPTDISPTERALRDLVKPMIKAWLDENMPRLVEEALRDEFGQTKKSD